MQIVVDLKAAFDVKTKSGYTTIHATDEGQDSCFRILVGAKADLNVKDNDGETVDMKAATNSANRRLNILIDTKVDLNVKDNDSELALARAIGHGKDGRAVLLRAISGGK